MCTLCFGSRREPPLVLGVPAPWSLGGPPATSSTLRLGVERRRHLCAGTETPPSWAISLSEDRGQGDRDCVYGRDLIAEKGYSS